MRRVSRLLFALFVLPCTCPLVTAAEAEVLPAIPNRIPFALSVHCSRVDELIADGVLEFRDGEARWKAPERLESSFARRLSLAAELTGRHEVKLRLTYECQGPDDPARRFCFETRAIDKDHKLLAHDWKVESDNRLGPAELPLGSWTFVRSRLNSPSNRLPRESLINIARFDIRLTEHPAGTPSHFPDGPHKLDLAISRSNRCGDFDVTFTNPTGWNLDPPRHQIAFQLLVCNDQGELVRADRRFLMYRADGNYRERVRVEPKYFDHSRVAISVYTRQSDNDKFISDFFYGGGAAYRGCWTGDGGELIELPIRGVELFKDLPEWAVAQAMFSNQ